MKHGNTAVTRSSEAGDRESGVKRLLRCARPAARRCAGACKAPRAPLGFPSKRSRIWQLHAAMRPRFMLPFGLVRVLV